MFGHRYDGKKVKNMKIIDRAGPFFMPQRIDAVNYINVKVPCLTLDKFIADERKEGTRFTYMDVVIATIVRILYMRPKMNRFIMRGSTYQRRDITVSLDVKKELNDEGESMTLKFFFTGRESIYEVKKIVENEIAKNMQSDNHATTDVAKYFTRFPDWLFRWALGLFRWFDKHGMFGKLFYKASPFHTSCFLTNLKSIKLPYIYHHIYNFGTTSMFISMGKEKMEPVVINNKELSIAKIMNLGISLDERIADGLYMSKTLRLMQDIIANPESLKEGLPDDGTIPTKIKKVKKVKKSKAKKVKTKKPKKVKETKEKKPKKIKPLKNKENALKRAKKTKPLKDTEPKKAE